MFLYFQLSDEKTYYASKYKILHSNFFKLKSEFDNLEQELKAERENSKRLEEANAILTKQLKVSLSTSYFIAAMFKVENFYCTWIGMYQSDALSLLSISFMCNEIGKIFSFWFIKEE